MKIELFMISSFEEYTNMHVCRKHWNFQWRGRRGNYNVNEGIRIRSESFGGLMKAPDGKLWKLDSEAYFYLNMLFN